MTITGDISGSTSAELPLEMPDASAQASAGGLPAFAVIGAQKAGSTFLLETLREHPQIFMPSSEVGYFEDGLYDPGRWDGFVQRFQAAQPGQVIGFKRPNLLGSPNVPERIRRDLGHPKLIVVLRPPSERAISAYFHYMATGLLPCLPLDVGIRKIFAGELEGWPRAGEILEFGRYGHHLERYGHLFGRSKLFVLDVRDLNDSDSILTRLFRFLEVDESFRPQTRLNPNNRPMAAPYSLTRIKIRRLLEFPVKTWNHDGGYFGYRGGIFWSGYIGVVRLFDKRVLAPLYRCSAPKAEEIRRELDDFYADDQTALARWLDGADGNGGKVNR